MTGFRELTRGGLGMPGLPASAVAAGRELGWAGRFKARRNMRRGRPGWDRTSARYQIAVGEQTRNMPMLFGRQGTQAAGVLIVLCFLYEAISSWDDRGFSAQFAFFVVFGLWMAWAFSTFGSTLRNAGRVEELNRPLLAGADPDEPDAPSTPSGSHRPFGIAVTIVYSAVVYLLVSKVLDDDHQSWAQLVGPAVLWAIGFVVLMRWSARRHARRHG